MTPCVARDPRTARVVVAEGGAADNRPVLVTGAIEDDPKDDDRCCCCWVCEEGAGAGEVKPKGSSTGGAFDEGNENEEEDEEEEEEEEEEEDEDEPLFCVASPASGYKIRCLLALDGLSAW